MLEGIIAVAVGAVLASGFLVGFIGYFVQGYVGDRFNIGGLVGTGDGLGVAPGLLAVGVLLAGVSSLITLTRYLRV